MLKSHWAVGASEQLKSLSTDVNLTTRHWRQTRKQINTFVIAKSYISLKHTSICCSAGGLLARKSPFENFFTSPSQSTPFVGEAFLEKQYLIAALRARKGLRIARAFPLSSAINTLGLKLTHYRPACEQLRLYSAWNFSDQLQSHYARQLIGGTRRREILPEK